MTEPWRPWALREYAFIADGERGALVGPDGAITWLCVPRWDSPAVFAALAGGRGGYAVTPADPWHVWGGYYEPGTLIWHSRWVSAAGVTECQEALARPADPHRAVLLRRVTAADGPARLRVRLDLRGAFGRTPVRGLSRSGGIWTGHAGPVRFRLAGAARARPGPDGLDLTLTLRPGQQHDLVLEISDRALGGRPPDPDRAWMATRDGWRAVVPDCADLIAVSDARHAYAVLDGLTSASGAMAAAATTSLPERSEGVRNYDYRYAWIRDQCYAGLAVAAHGPHPLLDGAVRFITERVLADGPGLMPAYTVAGGRVPAERALPLRGYPGGTVRTGNRVTGQFQLDALGEALQLLAAAARLDQAGPDTWRAAQVAADAIGKQWAEPDAGVWELAPRRWAHSRLACVAGLRAMARAAGRHPGDSARRDAGAWSSLADQILASLADCVHPSGRWQRAPGDERADAALLLAAVRGAVSPGDPRSAATACAVAAELSDDGFVYRFRHDPRPLHEAEGAFLLCGHWMALAARAGGDATGAARWFERSRAACGPAGIYAEEYDVHQRQLRGNLPQAFVHAGLLETAAVLSLDSGPVPEYRHA